MNRRWSGEDESMSPTPASMPLEQGDDEGAIPWTDQRYKMSQRSPLKSDSPTPFPISKNQSFPNFQKIILPSLNKHAFRLWLHCSAGHGWLDQCLRPNPSPGLPGLQLRRHDSPRPRPERLWVETGLDMCWGSGPMRRGLRCSHRH